jgi:hypothetical protein
MKQKTANKKIVIVARQAGSARAFVTLIKKMKVEGWFVIVLAFEHAKKVFDDENINSILIDSFNKAVPVLNIHYDARVLLSGTSEYAFEDSLFWDWSRTNEIPSIAFVDSWVNYWQRFTSDGIEKKKFNLTPDKIAVIDKLMQSRMIEFGCDKEKLIITGNPAFEVLSGYRTKNESEIFHLYSDYILFIGEPFNKDFYKGTEKDILGYTEAEVLSFVLDAVVYLNQTYGKAFRLVYKPHPRGMCSEDVKTILKKKNISIADNSLYSYDLVACSKAVVGMTSMLLYEAMIMGRVVISYSPDEKVRSDIINQQNGIVVVRNIIDLVNKLSLVVKPEGDIIKRPLILNSRNLDLKSVLNKYIK